MRRCLDPVNAEPQEVFGGPSTDPHKVFGRLGVFFSRDLKSTIPGDYYFNGRRDLQGDTQCMVYFPTFG